MLDCSKQVGQQLQKRSQNETMYKLYHAAMVFIVLRLRLYLMCIRGKKKFRLRVLEFLCVSCRLLKSGDEEGRLG